MLTPLFLHLFVYSLMASNSVTNQIFPILPKALIKKLSENFFFYEWEPYDEEKSVIRLVTGFGTTEADVDAFLDAIK